MSTDESVDSTTMDENNILHVEINNIKQASTVWQGLSATIWDNSWWLPNNLTWDDIQPTKEVNYPAFRDPFIYPFIFSMLFIFIKYRIINPYVMEPMANSLGLWSKKHPPPSNQILEDVFKDINTNLNGTVLKLTATQLGWSERQVERWLRQRKSIDKYTKYDKFLQCGYECLSHIFFCAYGLIVMFNKPYLWDISLCWSNYPFHPIDVDVWWYYMLVAGWYWSHMILHIYLPSRKDKRLVIVHHLCTLFLMTFSWICNFVRIGTLVILVHEIADIFVLAGKMCIYSKRTAYNDIIFGLFFISWCVTRVGIYPFWIVHSVFTDAMHKLDMPSAIVFEGLLLLLLLLNVLWTYFLFKMAILKLSGQEVKDTRSESEDSEEDKKME